MEGGGGFGSGAAHSASGSSGSFQQGRENSSSSSSRRHRYYDDPYYYRNSAYPNAPYPRSEADATQAKASCFGPAVFLMIGTVALFFGLYSPLQMEAGVSYSRVLSANPLFVREIEFKQNDGAAGAYVYAFHKPPPLNHHQELRYDYNRYLDSQRHQEWALWLNKGSVVTLSYSVPHGQSIILTVLKGRERFTHWLDDPFDAQSSLFWQTIQGEGRVQLAMDEDNDYYFAFGNTDYQSVKVKLDLEARLVLYDTTKTISQCSPQTQTCTVKLPLFQSTSALLTTPAEPQSSMDVWRFKASYKTRWWTYIIGYGTLLAIIVAVTRLCKKPSQPPPASEEKAPLVPPEAVDKPSDLSEQSAADVSSRVDGAPEDRLCAVCLDAEKDSFFDPCGHCATCYTCGVRIKESANAICPICRANISAVRRLFR